MSLCRRRVEQLVEVPETVSRDGVQQRTVEQIVESFKVFSQDRIQQRAVEQTIPAIPLAEKTVELPVIQTAEKTRQGVNTHAQYVVDTVEVERPKIIDEDSAETNHPGEDQPDDQAR